MLILEFLLLIVECFLFCYLYLSILTINKDIDTLYERYSNAIIKNNEIILSLRKELDR